MAINIAVFVIFERIESYYRELFAFLKNYLRLEPFVLLVCSLIAIPSSFDKKLKADRSAIFLD